MSYVHTTAELVEIVDSRKNGGELAELGFTPGHEAATFKIGEVVYAQVRNGLRACKVAKIGRQNLTVECTTPGAIDEAARRGWSGPCLTAKVVRAADVFRSVTA